MATQKEPRLAGLKLLLLTPTDVAGIVSPSAPVIAIDAVGAGVGDVVLFASGSSARQTDATKDKPVDAVVMAIVDMIEREGQVTYKK